MSDTELIEALAREMTHRSLSGWVSSVVILQRTDWGGRYSASGFGHSAVGVTASEALRSLLEFVAKDQVTEGRG